MCQRNGLFFSSHTDVVDIDTILIRMLDLLDPNKMDNALQDILSMLMKIKFTDIEKRERIALIDNAIKFGSIEIVKFLACKYEKLGISDDIRIPYEGHGEHPYRPVFWLAAVVTRLPYVQERNYQEIEIYLCEKFNIPTKVNIDGSLLSRDEYVEIVNEWKQAQNLKLRNYGLRNDRYTTSHIGTSTR